MLKRLMTTAAAVVALSASSYAQEVTLKVAAFIPEAAPTFAQVMKPWADAINAEGEGILQIDTFTGGSLGGDPAAQPDLVLDGVADAALVIPAYSPGRFPDNEVMELPGLMQNSTESSVAIRRLYERGLLRGYDDFYVVMLSTTNPYAIHTTEPVDEISDIAGMKLRAGGPVAGAAMRALGAAPVGMPITQVAENVSKGVIDGSGGDWDVMYSFRIIETCTNHFMASLGTVPVAVLMNREVYEGLSDEAKALIDKHSGEGMSRRFGAVHDGVQEEGLEKTLNSDDHTVVFPTDEQIAEWNEIMEPVINNWVEEHPNGEALLAALKEELASVRAE